MIEAYSKSSGFLDALIRWSGSRADDKCLVTLNHTRIQDRKEADMLRDGWGACFDKLKVLLEK